MYMYYNCISRTSDKTGASVGRQWQVNVCVKCKALSASRAG